MSTIHGVTTDRRKRTLRVLALCWIVIVPATASACGTQRPPVERPITGFALYALSRGKGVPEDALLALDKARAILEDDRKAGTIISIHEERIGIEGETRICAEYADPNAARVSYQRISKLAEGTDLVNLVVEPCQHDPKRSPTQPRLEDSQ